MARAVTVCGAVLAALCLPPAVGTAPAGSPPEPEVEVQYPFVCTTARNGLGQPQVDNHDGEGIPVAEEAPDGSYPSDDRGYPTDEATIVGWSRDCEVEPRFTYFYLTTGDEWVEVPAAADVPAEGVATTTTTEGRTVPFVVRLERGTINRFIYSVAMLATTDETDPTARDTSLWNRRLVFSFQGGVAIGHTQGSWSRSAALFEDALRLGYAVAYSTGTRTATHYNLRRGGQTAVLTKQHVVDAYGEPLYTIGVGGSGGAIQQYVYAQNHPGLLDGGVPQYSYPDMVSQTIHVGDCELLEHYFERTDAANPRWHDIVQRRLAIGLNAERDPFLDDDERAQIHAIYQLFLALGVPVPDGWSADDPGTIPVTECRPGWFGLTPLVMNPTFTDVDDIEHLAEGTDEVAWTHWDDARDVYGVDDDGWARQTWDNVGVQYGLRALRAGLLPPAEFLRLNALVGGWKHASEMVEEGFPFNGPPTAANLDPWSSRQMDLSPDGEAPAPRTGADVVGITNAFRNGHVFRGELDIPVIDWRHHLEHQLDMHNAHQSFATRARIDRAMGHHDAQLVWFTDARPGDPQVDHTMRAFEVLHEWIMNIRANPAAGVGGNRPAAAVDRCWSTDGTVIAEGDDVWHGVLDDLPPGACTRAFPLHTTSRIEAGAPITGDVFKCHTMPVATAVAEGLYGSWQPSADEVAQLEAIHPTGVCDHALPSVGRPGAAVPPAPVATPTPGGLDITGAEPGATVSLRRRGAVLTTATADGRGTAQFTTTAAGPFVVSQTVDGRRSLLSTPVVRALRPLDPAPFCGEDPDEPPFDDIAGHTFEAEVACAWAADLTDGTGPSSYSPGGTVTRAQMASLVARLIDAAAAHAVDDDAVVPLPPHDDRNRFVDVAPGDVHLPAVNRLARAGIVLGGPGGSPSDHYGPGLPVTRAQLATYLTRALGHAVGGPITSDTDHFLDDDGDVHEPSIDAVAARGVAVGDGAGRYRPAEAVTRGQMAAFLVRTLAVVEQLDLITPLAGERPS